ncbi:DUF4340 domain-containing protein [Verrucomicrobiaceae bacterium N1E253]|uniref:DUF4340 domain-containing protein n=1 Tax=Oceaniferula marina TaxID=2748318 RepID=A0A851GQK3_9BACT|nr:DUF4340 domain-containing protein [Oceaniferula marina]NWK57100.1 DUF4340 domain-containing protein [Oceaniferula marina]
MRYLSTILLALLSVTLLTLALVHTDGKYRDAIFGTPAAEPGKKLFDVESLNQVRRITLTDSEGKKATFQSEGNIWIAQEPWNDRADMLFIRTLFQFTASLEVQEVIPRKDLELRDFGLRKGNTRVSMYDAKGENICDYRIGRQAAWKVPVEDGKSTMGTSFIRLADKDLKHNIYLCSSPVNNIQNLFNNQFERFRDHHPFYFSHQFLDKTRIQNDEGEVVISRETLRSPWRITKPLDLRVDPTALADLFTNLARLRAVKVEDRANVTLPTAEQSDAHSREIAIHSDGMDEDFVLRVYLPEKEGETVALATVSNRPDTVFHLPMTSNDPGIISLSQFQTGVNDLRSKTMTHLNGPQLEKIIIKPQGSLPTLLARTTKTTWQVLRKNGYEAANQNAVISLMTAVTRDKIEKFVTDAASDLSPYGLDYPFLQLAFISFGGESLALAFGREPNGENIYAHLIGKPNIWQISPETLGKIAVHPWQWKTSHVWHIPKVDIEQITIHQNDSQPVNLKYAFFSEQWSATRGKTGEETDVTAELNPHRANNLLNSLESMEAQRWIGPMHPQALKALQTPDISISIKIKRVDDEGNDLPPITKTLRIANTPGNIITFAKVDTNPKSPDASDEDSYFLLNPDTAAKLKVNLFE